MRITSIAAVASMVAVLFLVPGMSSAATRAGCASTAPTARSNTWDFSHEAMNLMSSIHDESDDVVARADRMMTPPPVREYDWESQVAALGDVRRDINHMGQQLCRLETIRSTVPAWEQAEIDKAIPELNLMALHTTDAIHYLNSMHTGLWRPEYRKFESALQSEARNLSRLTGQCVRYSKVQSQEQQLKKDLGAGESF